MVARLPRTNGHLYALGWLKANRTSTKKQRRLNRRFYEIGAVLGTAVAKWVMVDWLALRPYFIVLAVSFWIFFIVSTVRKRENKLTYLGLGKDGIKPTTLICLGVGLPFAIGFGIYASQSGTLLWQAPLIPVLLLYPIWGMIQQLITMNFVAGNLSALRVKNHWNILLTGLAFAFVHLPDVQLTLATLALGLFYGWLFLRHRNIWPLGILHGWLGALFYYWAMGIDPWAEIMVAIG